jgi:hypothetical protein
MEKRLPEIEGSCGYIKQAIAGSRQGVVLQPGGLGKVLTTHRKNLNMLRIIHKCLGIELVLQYNLSIEEKWDWRGGMDWIDLAQDRDKWRALANTVMSLLVP